MGASFIPTTSFLTESRRVRDYLPLLVLELTFATTFGCGGIPEISGVPQGPDGNPMESTSDAGAEAWNGADALAGKGIDQRCTLDTDCPTGAVCSPEEDIGIPGGACVALCEPGASESCGNQAICRTTHVNPDLDFCSRLCERSDDCELGRACDGVSCVWICSADSDCRSGHCNPYTAACDSGASAAGLGLYASCTAHEDCRSGFCNPYGQRCTTSCKVTHPNCPEQGICLPAKPDTDSALCYPPCVDGSHCADRSLQCIQSFPGSPSACAFPNDEICIGTESERRYGADCRCAADCPDDAFCVTESASTGSPRGQCLRFCSTQAECGPAAVCSSAGHCEPSCSSDEDCPGVDLCYEATRTCVSLCQANEDCFGGHCDPYLARCTPTASEGNAMGEPCATHDDCKSRFCAQYGGELGFCMGICNRERSLCPDGTVCIGDGNAGLSLGSCMVPCEKDADCKDPLLVCLRDVTSDMTYCYTAPQPRVPTVYDATIELACQRAAERDSRCGESTISSDCRHAAQVETQDGTSTYDCLASAPCGQAGSCAFPPPTTLGDEICSEVERVCALGFTDPVLCANLNEGGGWFRQDVRESVRVCFTAVECDNLLNCANDWLYATLGSR